MNIRKYKIELSISKKSIVRPGITLPELLVAMFLVGILMTSTFYVFSNFFKASISQERYTLEQSDTQAGAQFLKWDIFMAGYGMPSSQLPISSSDNTGENSSDVLTLTSISFGPSGNEGRWTYIISLVSATNQILVRRWNDPDQDVAINDYITLLSPTKGQVGLEAYKVTNRQTATGPAGEDAWLLTLDNNVSSALNFVFVLGDSSGAQSVTYSIQNGNLMRDSTVFMPGVVDFQVAFWVDTDGDRIQDAGEIYNDLSLLASNPQYRDNIKLARISIVTASRAQENYVFSKDTITTENNTISTSALGTNFRYDTWQSIMNPRNL